jgi:hypothetical protein
MERVLYVVAREQPLMVGYLMTRVGARSPAGPSVEIKVDERRSERRLSSEARDPDRRSLDRRRRPSLDPELRDQGYAVVESEVRAPAPGEPTSASAATWRPRASWSQRAARAGRRRRTAFWAWILALLVVVGVSLVVASIRQTPVPAGAPAPQIAPPIARPAEPVTPPAARPAPPVAPPVAAPIAKAPPPPPVAKAEPVVPAVPPPSRPAPTRIVSTRSSGVVQSVDPRARTLVLEDPGVAGGRLRVELAPDARVVLSQREAQSADPTHPFLDTPIDLSDVRRGDYVVVNIQGPEGQEVGRSVTVTFRPR